MSSAARAIREALRDPLALCDALGLCDTAGRGRTWFLDGPNRLRVRCPWHEEKTGSCSVSIGPDGTVRVYCFGCRTGGDALTLIGGVHGLDRKREYLRIIEIGAALAGLTVPPPRARTEHPLPRRAPAPPQEQEQETCSVDLVADALRTLAPVAQSPVALAYLRARRLDAHGAALGWIGLPSSEHDLEMLRRRVVEAVGVEAWTQCGMAWPSGCFDPRWRGRLVIPWEAPCGAVEYLAGRAIGEPRDGEPRYLGLPRRRVRWPYGCANLHELSGPETAVAYVEGAIDALSLELWTSAQGVDVRCLGLPGLSHWRASWATLARGRDAIVALDNDAQGAAHAPLLTSDLKREARSVRRWQPAQAKDWNEHIVEVM